MALSPNYGWAEPDNSSLVKNGAQDIRALGDAIDTSVWNVGYGQAGKNKIINGDFNVNQRAFSSTTSSSVYLFDRWGTFCSDGTVTYTAQTFTPGAAPVAGYESKNYLNIQTAGQTLASAGANIVQYVEDVRTFAGQTVTLSFWAKAATGSPKIALEFRQNFGAGGSPSSAVATYAGQVTTSTSWARYSVTVAIPSLSGKTIGTTDTTSNLFVGLWFSAGSNLDARTGSLGIQSNTFSIWGLQLEAGSEATPFQTASGGSIQGELAMCQRYFNRFTSGAIALGNYFSTTRVLVPIALPVQMRIAPTGITPNSAAFTIYVAGSGRASSAVAFNSATVKVLEIDVTSAADTAGRVGSVTLDSGSFDVSTEL